MRIEKLGLFSVTFGENDTRYIEAETIEEALKIARKVKEGHILSIKAMNLCYRDIDA